MQNPCIKKGAKNKGYYYNTILPIVNSKMIDIAEINFYNFVTISSVLLLRESTTDVSICVTRRLFLSIIGHHV